MKDFDDIVLKKLIENRPTFKPRAVVTSGMPYGNKSLHCGHISMIIHADMFARFLRDRLGEQNVVYVSGTDCYGSPILEGYRKLIEEGKFSGSMEEWVKQNHDDQVSVLNSFDIKFNLYAASGLGEAKDIHKQMSAEVFNKLLKYNQLSELSTLQFYDEEKKTFLNGRQVIGRCPIEGCQSEKGYADECDLGHQYMPKDLISPISALSGKTPVLKSTGNWYFKLDNYIDRLKSWIADLETSSVTRPYVVKEIKEFLKQPEIYIKKEYKADFDRVANSLLGFELLAEDNKPSFNVVFKELANREQACEVLSKNNIRYRTGKTLVPFRLTGSIEWGVPAPDAGSLKNQTFWVWPESLWAPVSFSKTYLKSKDYKAWWCSQEARVYQFIGEDNIYFYGPAQTAMWMALGEFSIPQIVANKHTLFLGKKASSSSAVKPPMAKDLLRYYTSEQIRMHFLSMNVGNNNASFMPKVFNPEAKENEEDPAVREYNLLSNVYNKTLRTLFYTWQNEFEGNIPSGQVDDEIIKICNTAILKCEKFIYETKFHMFIYELDTLIRNMNKYWIKNYNEAQGDKAKIAQNIINTLHMAKVAMVLLHPITPSSCENLAEMLGLTNEVFSWQSIDRPIYDFIKNKPQVLQPRQDFFKKHPSQLINDN